MKGIICVLAFLTAVSFSDAAEKYLPTRILDWDSRLTTRQQTELENYLLSIGVPDPRKQGGTLCDLNKDGIEELWFRPRMSDGCNGVFPWHFLQWRKDAWVKIANIPECISFPIDIGERWMIFRGGHADTNGYGNVIQYRFDGQGYRRMTGKEFIKDE